MKRTSLIFALICCLLPSTQAENLFLRQGAAGSRSGADWNNAFTNWNNVTWSGGAGQLGAGDTLWIAGGTYSGFTPGVDGTFANRITIKRATTNDTAATSAAGWNATNDAQVVFSSGGNVVYFNGGGDFLTLDGQTDRGIKINVTDTADIAGIYFQSYTTGAVIRYIEVAGPSPEGTANFHHLKVQSCVETHHLSGGVWQPTSFTLQYCRLHGCNQIFILAGCANTIIEYTKMYDCNIDRADPLIHPNLVNAVATHDVIWRYNDIYNWGSEGIMFDQGTSQYNWWIYGNVWHDRVAGSFARVLETQVTANGPVYFFNNTIANAWQPILTGGGTWTGGGATNNILWGMAGYAMTLPHDYNWMDSSNTEPHGIYSTANPFVNLAGQDYHIVSTISASKPRDKGKELTSDGFINMDRDGVQRGGDGLWDMGAYEVAGTDTNAPVITALSSNSPGYTNVTLTFSLNESATYWIGYGTTTNLGTYSTNGPGSSASFTINGLTKATTYYWQASAVDVAGNPTNGAILSFATRTDTTNPTINITSGTSSSVTPYALTAVGSDDLAIDHVAWANAATGGSGTCTGTTTATASIPLAAGNNSITLTIYDSTGNTGTANVTVNYSTGTPTITTVTNFRIVNP